VATTSIEWTATTHPDTGRVYPGFTFNPWWGCWKISRGCKFCYADVFDHRLGGHHWGPSAPRRFFDDDHWRQPFAWAAKARKLGLRLKVFCASMADVFEDRRDLDIWRARLWRLIEKTPELDWLLLTKRPEMMTEMDPWPGGSWPENVWALTTVEDQPSTARIDHLGKLRARAVVLGLSCEPLVSALNLDPWLWEPGGVVDTDIGPEGYGSSPSGLIDWIICGGESGHGASPMHPNWARSLRDQCRSAGVAFHFKQFGEWAPIDDDTPRGAKLVYVDARGGVTPAISPYEPGCPCDHDPRSEPMVRLGKKRAGRLLDGREWNEFPQVPARCD
jgi:protein gp37